MKTRNGSSGHVQGQADADSALRGMRRQGWASLALWMTVGLTLEGLLGYKVPAYLGDAERRELLRLAHTHGTLLSVVLLAAALAEGKMPVPAGAIYALRAGSVLMPVGFLLSGIWHPEGDPGTAIWLVPLGALLVIFAALLLAFAAKVRG